MKKIYLCFLVLFMACGVQKKNPVILISIDNLSPQYLEKMENLREFSKEAVIFKNAYTQYPFCLPSHLQILTSTSFLKNKCYLNEFYYLNKDIITSAEIFKNNGYKTFAFVSGKPLRKLSGISKGFDIYNDLFYMGYNKNLIYSSLQKDETFYLSYRPAEETIALALDSIKNEKKAYFLFIHLNDSYPPFSPPERFIKENPEDLYLASLSYIDYELGKFFKEIKKQRVFERSFIVITSDHGTIKEEKENGMELKTGLLKVPLLIKFPDNFKIERKEIKELLSTASIFPSIFSYLKIKDTAFLKQSEGENFKDLISENKREKNLELPCLTLVPYHYYGLNPKYGTVFNDGKIKEEKVFLENFKNFEEDLNFYKDILRAKELLENNQIKQSQEILSKYYDKYKNSLIYLKTLLYGKLLERDLKGANIAIDILKENFSESPDLDFEKYKVFLNFQEREEALNLLYNSMKNYYPFSNFIFEAFSLEEVKNKKDIENFLKKIPANYEENVKFLFEGIKCLFDKDEEKAKENFEKALLLGAETPIPYFQYGLILKKEGKVKDALPYFYSAYILNQNNARYLYELADTFAILGDFEKAYNFFKKAYLLQPLNFSIEIGLLKTSYLTNRKEEVNFLKNEILKNYGSQIEEIKKQDKLLQEIISGSP